MPVGTGSIKRAAAKATETDTAAKKAVSAPKKNTAKKNDAKKVAPKKTAQPKETVKSSVITGANPDVKFYRISDDLPIHLL